MPQICNYWRDSCGPATTPGHCTDHRLKHTSSLSVKEASCSSGSFGLRGRLQVWHPSRGLGFPGSSVVKNLPASARDVGLIPGSGRSPEGGQGNPLQYTCLENPMDRGAWRATVYGVAKESDMTETEQHHTAERPTEVFSDSEGLLAPFLFSPTAPLSSPVPPRKELIYLSDSFNSHPEDTSRLSDCSAHWVLCMQSHWTEYICIL